MLMGVSLEIVMNGTCTGKKLLVVLCPGPFFSLLLLLYDPFDLNVNMCFHTGHASLNLINKTSHGKETVKVLGSLLTALDSYGRWNMAQKNSHRSLVHLLSAPAGSPDKLLLNILPSYPKVLDPLFKGLELLKARSQAFCSFCALTSFFYPYYSY